MKDHRANLDLSTSSSIVSVRPTDPCNPPLFLFIGVNDVVCGLNEISWLPALVPVLCAHHRIDGQALCALTSKDLRRFFFLEDGALQQRLLSFIALCDLLSSWEEE